MLNISRAALLSLIVAGSPTLPECSDGQLIVSNGSSQGYRCASLNSLLEKQRASGWGAENVLPTCSSGEFLQSEGFGRWRCLDPEKLMPRCSSGDTLRSNGSSGWSCERRFELPSCSSGEALVSSGGSSWSCQRLNK
ncbi:MAG: hypothetical protein JNM17_07200 [Archangium sp.]|nr:hypothetical protein [Archangium sp.]